MRLTARVSIDGWVGSKAPSALSAASASADSFASCDLGAGAGQALAEMEPHHLVTARREQRRPMRNPSRTS
jgi:hypothetical protein